jgi:undecaprenyl-diphosphatase
MMNEAGAELRPDRPNLWSAATARIRNYELSGPLALFVAAAGLLGFLSLTDEVLEGETGAFDRAILLALRNPTDLGNPIGPAWLAEAARDVTALGSMTVLGLATLLVAMFLAMGRKRAAAALVVVSVGGGMLLSSLLKMLIERTRPDLVPHLVEVFTASFPSGHATMSAITI